MPGPLDDAARELGVQEQFERQWRNSQNSENEVQRGKLRDLIEDFLDRMAIVGKPTDDNWKISRFRKVGLWHFPYADGEKPGHLNLTVDGRVVELRNSRPELVPYQDLQMALTDDNLKSLGQYMVSRLRNAGAM